MENEILSAGVAMELDVLNEIPSGVGVFDVTGAVVDMKFVNDGFYRMMNARREERTRFFGTGTLQSVHPDDREGMLYEVAASIRENRMFEYRFRNVLNDGSYLWIGIRATHKPLNDKTERFFASYYDVDKYITEKNKLEAYNNDLDAILGNIPGGVAVFSESCGEIRLKYANMGFYELHHGSREYWLKRSENPVEWLSGQERDLFIKAFDTVKSGDKDYNSVAYRVMGEDGILHWVGNRFRRAYQSEGIQYYYATFMDLDKLKSAEQRMEETRRMYEAAVEESNLVVWEYDIENHRITMAENEFTQYDYRKFGLPKITENAPYSLIPYIDDAYVDTFLELYRQVDSGSFRVSCEVWYKLTPGTEPRCERITYTTLFDENGKPAKAYGIGQNITQQKLAQAEYDRLRAQLTGNLADVVSSTQLNISKNFYIDGYSPYPQVEKSLECKTADEHFIAAAEAIPNDTIKNEILKTFVCSNLSLLFKEGTQRIERTYPVRTSYGGILWVCTKLRMMQNPSTGDVEAITYSKDITKQKRNHEIVSRLASTGCDFIGVIDVAENIFEMHTSNWEYISVPAGEIIDYDVVRKKLVDNCVMPEKRQALWRAGEMAVLEKALKEKTQYIVSYECINQSTAAAPLRKQIVLSWLNDDEKEILCVQQDVTEAYRKEQEQIAALEAAKNEADAANEAKSTFLSGMSHDLRTPLNGVLSFTAFALKENDPQKKQDYLRKIDVSGKLLLDLINDTLELSRIESGKASVETEAVMPYNLIPVVTTALRPSAELKNLSFETDFSIDADTPIWCDKLKLQKIAMNLISNAIKYTPEGGKVSVGLKTVPMERMGNCFLITVEDNGIGMSEEFVKHMYEPFSQEKRSDSIQQLGTGLGLSIVKRYVDLMNGRIDVESQLHKGTRIQVYIPISTENRNLVKIKADKDYKRSLAGKHVLLCEDNIMNTEIAIMLLKDRGVAVDTAENGKVGLEKFMASDIGGYNAILMDIRMPIMDGYEAVKRIRALPRADATCIPIIAMTADAFEESVREAKLTGMDAYVTKPIDPVLLYETLANTLC
jgi:signal transduction histidine kinase/PAS domain-containing protein